MSGVEPLPAPRPATRPGASKEWPVGAWPAVAGVMAAGVTLIAPMPARTGPVSPAVSDLAAPTEVGRYERFEVTATITPEPENPFDPAQIDVQSVFRGPGGSEHRAVGFYYQGYRRRLADGRERLAERGAPVWKTRFAPPTAGTWEWWWEVRTPAGSVETDHRRLEVVGGDDPGFVRRSEHDSRYLAFDDGSPYFAIGENTGWYDDRGTFAYDDWFGALETQGATYGRLWMSSWAFGLEWEDTGLGEYRDRLDRAWQLDRVLRRAERSGLYLELSLLNHGAFSTVFSSEWRDNPYNAANGGPLASPAQFLTNAEAKARFRQRLRYIVARWGYSTHVLAWELWNEVDLTDGYDSATSAVWHREMTDELRRLDPSDHLVTTSFALAANDPAVWARSGLDYTQLHAYARAEVAGTVIDLFSDIARHVTDVTATRLREVDQPVLFAELGTDARGPVETEAGDPDGIAVHDGLWAGALAGGFGTAMTWWWDNLIDVNPRRYYPMFGSIARFLEGVEWDRQGFLGGVARGSHPVSSARPLTTYGLQGTHQTLLWIKDDAHQWHAPDPAPVTDATITFSSLAPSRWCGEWWDTRKGRPLERFELVAQPGAEAQAVPVFTGDVAVRLERC